VEVLKHARTDPRYANDLAEGLAIHQIDRGSVFGEMSFVDGDLVSATIRAATDCELLRLSHSTLARIAEETGVPILDRLNGAVAQAVIRRLRMISDQHVRALQREINEIRLRHAFERFFMATMVLFGIASLVQRLIQQGTSPWPHMAFSWGFLLLSLAPMAWFALRQKRPWADFGVTLINWRKSVTEGLAVTAVLVVLACLVTRLFLRKDGEPLLNWGSVGAYNSAQFAVFVLGYPVHCFLQEFIGRGVIQTSFSHLLPRARKSVPLLATSALFGIYHLYVSVSFAILTVVVSMLFGWLYDRHKTLTGVTVLHASIGLASVALGFN
jgi:membrane protease YdiL (CAAX protease family)